MKKILLGTLLMFCLTTFGQTYKIEEKSITGVFDVDGKSKAEIFSAINKWISINYNSAKNVIQLNDAEAGNIIIKGINEVTCKSVAKTLYPKNAYIPENTTTKFNHLIEINVKENKFRIIYRIIDSEGLDDNFFNCIKLNGDNEANIITYNDEVEIGLKKGLIGQEKRELYKLKSTVMFEDIRFGLENSMKATMLSIEKSVKTATTDGW
ncbi:MAG: DUF4468 domain-containing protein [Flavobacterium sp.]|nr:DUF4468 domain-containing protein [Flavobacterium sp.]